MKLFLRPLQSCEKLRREPATRWFDGSFAPIPWSDERFARQYRFGLPSGFPLTLSSLGIVHHLSGPNMYTITFIIKIEASSEEHVTPIFHYKLMMPGQNIAAPVFLIIFHFDYVFLKVSLHFYTRIHIRLLGPCFKTGQLKLYLLMILFDRFALLTD